MTYGDHYRKKLVEDIENQREHLEQIMREQKRLAEAKRVSALKAAKTSPRYDLNELRHHQRRCAALLFGARKEGAHQVPLLVRWAPRRRESYYLMSERLYNDRLLMKLREQEEEEKRGMLASPLNFDFVDKLVDTSHLYDFQKLVQKTSKHLKGMQFDTQFNDNIYTFSEVDRKRFESEEGRVLLTPDPGDGGKGGSHPDSSFHKQQVKFSDETSEQSSGESGQTSHSSENEEARKSNLKKTDSTLELGDIDVGLSVSGKGRVPSDLPDGVQVDDENLQGLLSSLSVQNEVSTDEGRSRARKPRRRSVKLDYDGDHSGMDPQWSRDLTDRSSQDGDYDYYYYGSEEGDELSQMGGSHNNKYCKHPGTSLKNKARDYYKRLPRLLKTSELREKAAKLKIKPKKERPSGPYADHKCMDPHRTAYERALALVRGRGLPADTKGLYNKTSRRKFSYFPGLGDNVVKGRQGKSKKVSKLESKSTGRAMIFGSVDMNDFYREEDELIYYIKRDKLRTVVESSASEYEVDDVINKDNGDEGGRDIRMVTTATGSGSYTLQIQSSLAETDNESQQS
ncbi:uncharacterized protein LOC5521116 [Nematostella vectensis]|uniref:uncharacterized protein LOC5521116 n=1 Tax=Nematostella vectensis TaxID=45351 RepID=UPI002077681E|nr:uncharacterized protein LOC5521116 [Nematostella vectensis]